MAPTTERFEETMMDGIAVVYDRASDQYAVKGGPAAGLRWMSGAASGSPSAP